MQKKLIKNLVYKKSNIPKLANYDRVQKGIKGLKIKKIKSILDIGCGPGQVFHALKKKNYKGYFMGVDNDKTMIDMANDYYNSKKFENFHFHVRDLKNINIKKKFDCILIWGVISFVDDYKSFLNNMIKMLNKGGSISLFSGFTENNYNVYVKYAYRNGNKQNGLNMYSINEIERYFKKKHFKIKKNYFMPNVNLKKKKNPLGSYFLYEKNKKKILANGLNIIRRFYFVNASKL
tara:strand:- start:708 stop:1409 length:702 start_codon:yes stop_codon:yes gene_type:complete